MIKSLYKNVQSCGKFVPVTFFSVIVDIFPTHLVANVGIITGSLET